MKKLVTSRLLSRTFSVMLPILFALFPILFLYAHNPDQVSLFQVLRLMTYSVFATLCLWVLLTPLMKNAVKTGLATSLCVVFFFSYGRFYDLLTDSGVLVPRHSYLLPAGLLVLAYCIYFIRILRIDFGKPTKILSAAVIALIFVNLASLTLNVVKQDRSLPALDLHDVAMAETDLTESDTMPDIYYIVLDEYAHPSTMLEYYDYDNSRFIDDLADRGFFVASGSTVAYSQTWKSIASSLNMEYLSATESIEFYFQRIANSKVANSLRSIGYTYVYFGSWFDAGRYRVDADVYYNFYESSGGSAAVGNFSRTLWNTTMARPFYDHLTGSICAGQYRSAILDTLQCLKTIPDVEGPKFVFAHILSPHLPFVFGPNGEYVDPADWYNVEDSRFYLGQYTFISNEIAAVVDDLIEKSSSEPVIILQSDHGPRPGVSGCVGISGSEWPKVLNAYYMPGDCNNDDLHDSISPVNSFRMVFNRYFGAQYDQLQEPGL